jgi:hypothetical protein
MNKLELRVATLDLESGGQPAGTLDLTGAMDLAAGSGGAEAKLTVPQPMRTARALGLTTDTARTALDHATLEATQKIQLTGRGARVAADGTARLSGIGFKDRDGTPRALAVDSQSHVEWDGAAQTIRLEPVRLELKDETGAGAGHAEAKGQWPMAAGGAGEMTLTVRGVDLAPWLVMLRALPGDQPPPLPFEADEKISLLPDGKIHLAGELRVGLTPAGGADADKMAVQLKHEVDRLGRKLEKIVLDFASSTAGGPADAAHLEGAGTLDPAPSLDFTGQVASLDADPYVAWWNSLRPAERPEEQKKDGEAAGKPGGPAAPKSKPVKHGDEAPASRVQARLDVRRATYKTSILENAIVAILHENGATDLNIEQGKLCGGEIKAAMQYDGGRIEPRYGWQLDLQGAQASPLLGAIDPRWAEKLSGLATIQSKGTGEGIGRDALRRMQSESNISVIDGRVRDWMLTNLLADRAGMDELREFPFKDLTGQVSVENGKALLKQWLLDGSDRKLTLDGALGLLGDYKLNLSSWQGPVLAAKIDKNQYMAALLRDGEGFVRFPLDIEVESDGGKPKVRMKSNLIQGGQEGADSRQQLENLATGVLGGLIEKQAEKREKKEKKKREQEAQRDEAEIGVQP